MTSSLPKKLRSRGIEFVTIIADSADQIPRLLSRDVVLSSEILDLVWLIVRGRAPIGSPELLSLAKHDVSQNLQTCNGII
jgi:hypothetical protein